MADVNPKVESSKQDKSPSRRNFIKNGSMMLAGGAIVGGNLSVARGAHAYGSDTIKIGLVGCGGRGTGANDICRRSATLPNLVCL